MAAAAIEQAFIDEKTIIEKYLSDGGKVYLILGDTTSDTPNLDEIMSDYGLKKVSGYIADTQRCYQGNYYAIFPQLSLSGDLGSGISNQMVLLLNSPGMEKIDKAIIQEGRTIMFHKKKVLDILKRS